MAGISETLHATSLRTRDISNEASAPLRTLPGYQSRDATCCVRGSMRLRVKDAPYRGKTISTGGGRRCCSFRAVADIGKPNPQGVAALCPGLCAHCPLRTLTIPPPRRDVACYVSNIPADDPNGDVARISNISKRRRCTQRLYGQGDVSKE